MPQPGTPKQRLPSNVSYGRLAGDYGAFATGESASGCRWPKVLDSAGESINNSLKTWKRFCDRFQVPIR